MTAICGLVATAAALVRGDEFWHPFDTLEPAERNTFIHPEYPSLYDEVASVFHRSTATDADPTRRPIHHDTLLPLWDGSKRTAPDHLDHIHQRLLPYFEDDCPGFRSKSTFPGTLFFGSGDWEKDGVLYDLHDEMSAAGNGAGFYRLRAEMSVPPAAFAALMMDAKVLAQMDHTVRMLDYVMHYPDNATWLSYWRASPGAPLKDLDGLDITGFRRGVDGTLFQISVSTPDAIPWSSADRAVDMYWGYKLVPIDGGKRTKLTLICQTDLRNWIPKWASNLKVAEVLADYVTTADKTALTFIAEGKMEGLIAKFGLADAADAAHSTSAATATGSSNGKKDADGNTATKDEL